MFRPGDANTQLFELSKALNTGKYAALILLDPFGMQIDWQTIEALRGTRSDVWLLVPTGVIVNRLLDRKGELKHTAKLQSFFGMSEEDIRAAFYEKKTAQTLFGEHETETKISKLIQAIARLYTQRMKTVWKHVTEQPLQLLNKNGVPIFHFVFASNNPTAIKIAGQIIQKL